MAAINEKHEKTTLAGVGGGFFLHNLHLSSVSRLVPALPLTFTSLSVTHPPRKMTHAMQVKVADSEQRGGTLPWAAQPLVVTFSGKPLAPRNLTAPFVSLSLSPPPPSLPSSSPVLPSRRGPQVLCRHDLALDDGAAAARHVCDLWRG